MSDAWNERIRLIRFRRKRERTRFRDELRIIPKWLVWTCIVVSVLALIIGISVNLHNFGTHDPIFPDESPAQPAFSFLPGARRRDYVWCIRLFSFPVYPGLRLSRRQAPRNESRPVDAAGPHSLGGLCLHRLDHLSSGARAAAIRLPAMRGHRFRALQFLPQLQIQPASRLPALPARSW